MAADHVIDSIVAQHADESAFLCRQRGVALGSAQLTLRQLARHDDRLAAHIDGLRVAAEAGWHPTPPGPDHESCALFAAAVLALEAGDVARIGALLSQAEEMPTLQPGLIAAFGWISAAFLQGIARQLLTAKSPFHRRVGIACCVAHGADPGHPLIGAVTDPEPVLRAAALSAVGQLGKFELDSMCVPQLGDENPGCRLAAAACAVTLGNRGIALDALTRIALEPGAGRAEAFRLTLQAMNLRDAHGVLQQLRTDPDQLRWLIQGSGIAGDPAYVSWLINHMRQDKTARLAGEAFTLITGADFNRLQLERDRPETFESGPNDDPHDPNVDMDPDDGLPWPDAPRVDEWWAANGDRFQQGIRYFMGAPVTREHCTDVLKNACQRQRIVAAHYLCLLEPGTPLFNTSAPAWRQQRLLAKMT
jgi:uncharacterized protein (TIGR02270 family)